MSLEVELKAHVLDHVTLKQRIESLLGISPCSYAYKEDTYFSHKGEDALFRMRVEQAGPSFEAMQGSMVFTFKNKTMRAGIEVNEEAEFTSTSDQGPAALQFFLGLGYETYMSKTKKGYAYTYPVTPDLPPLTIELVEVIGLGWFLEMEFVLAEASMVEQATDSLLGMLDLLEIDRKEIEEAYYMHLLKEKKPEA